MEENILEALGLQNLSEDEQARLVSRMMAVVQGRINDRVVGGLNETQRSEFENLVAANPSEEKLEEWLKTNVPTFDQIAIEETGKFKQEMIENAQALRAMVTDQPK